MERTWQPLFIPLGQGQGLPHASLQRGESHPLWYCSAPFLTNSVSQQELQCAAAHQETQQETSSGPAALDNRGGTASPGSLLKHLAPGGNRTHLVSLTVSHCCSLPTTEQPWGAAVLPSPQLPKKQEATNRPLPALLAHPSPPFYTNYTIQLPALLANCQVTLSREVTLVVPIYLHIPHQEKVGQRR